MENQSEMNLTDQLRDVQSFPLTKTLHLAIQTFIPAKPKEDMERCFFFIPFDQVHTNF